MQDTADGEFSVIKTAIARYRKQSDMTAADYLEVKDSASVTLFGEKFLSRPSERSKLQARYFDNIPQDTFLARKATRTKVVKTLTGISTKFQYFCQVS